jgi:hypothetical protein
MDFNGFSFFLGMYLDFFGRKILDVLTRKDEPKRIFYSFLITHAQFTSAKLRKVPMP